MRDERRTRCRESKRRERMSSANPPCDDDKCLDDLWVHPDAWGRGVGPKLIAQIEDEQRNVGVSRLTAWAPEDSPRARGVLAKMGWRPTGEEQPMVIYPEQPNTLFEYERILV